MIAWMIVMWILWFLQCWLFPIVLVALIYWEFKEHRGGRQWTVTDKIVTGFLCYMLFAYLAFLAFLEMVP